ncbi:MAG: copper chaperone [Bacteroidetes bacterium]|nr:MAG: copper chaperone [Bacteroidota bacterium]
MNRFLLIPLLLLLFACGGETQTRTFFVEGNCPECGDIIVKTLERSPGVEAAKWDFESSQATVTYNSGLTDEENLQEAVAEAGFSTTFFDPDPVARELLPPCCQESIGRSLLQQQGHP